MLLSSAFITGTVLVVGVRRYKENKKKREMPWTFYAKRLGVAPQNRTVLPPSGWGQTFVGRLSSKNGKTWFEEAKAIVPKGVLGDGRGELLPDIPSVTFDSSEISSVEKEVNRDFAISLLSLGLTTTGALFYAPLALLSLPGLIYFAVKYLISTFESVFIRKESRESVALLESGFFVGVLVTGNLFAASLAFAFYTLSRKLLVKTENHSRKSLINVFGEQPRSVWVQQEGIEIEIPFEQLKIGDLVVIGAGQTIPIDGTISDGMATIDQRTLTGESQPVEKGVGDPVFASTVVLDGKIWIEVKKTGQDTVAAQIGNILNATADFKSSVQSRGEEIVNKGARPTLALSLLALPFLGLQSAIAIVTASFGYNMKVAAPIGVLNFLRIASENGILIKDGRSLELLSQVDTFVFDKTGTLTEEVPTIAQIIALEGYNEKELLTLTAAAEYKQTHPIALAILQEADKRELKLPEINEAKVELGYGLKVSVGKQLIRVGSNRFMAMEEMAIPAHIKKVQDDCHEKGHTLIYVAIDNQLGGVIELCPTIRPETKQITSELRKRNISMVIISGDHEKPTKKLAQEVGIDRYFAETLPQNKAALIEQLQKEGKSVCFVGDGINDSIALKKANVSISLSGASSVATDTASIILMDGTLNQLIPLLDVAQELDTNISRSTIMSIVPGIITVGGVYFLHFGIVASLILYEIGLVASLSNAMLPLIKRKVLSNGNRSSSIKPNLLTSKTNSRE